jgi:CBS domain containing-hemolysin-like protein
VQNGNGAQPPPAPTGGGWLGRLRRRHGGTGAETDPARTEQEQLILDALAEMRDMDVREVMTPRIDVVALSIPVEAEDVARAVRESGHSCFPVVDGDLDDVVGVLFVHDLFRTGRPLADEDLADTRPLDISRRLRTPHVVPETLGVLDALAEMRRHRRGFAVVVDEYGGMAGVLTVKDLLEPLVGELADEFEKDEPAIVRVDRQRWLVDGQVGVDEVRESLGLELPDGDYVTLGGYLFDAFGHIPGEGERVTFGDWDLKVVEMDKRRIAQVVVRRSEPPDQVAGHAARASGVEGDGDREAPEPAPVRR